MVKARERRVTHIKFSHSSLGFSVPGSKYIVDIITLIGMIDEKKLVLFPALRGDSSLLATHLFVRTPEVFEGDRPNPTDCCSSIFPKPCVVLRLFS